MTDPDSDGVLVDMHQEPLAMSPTYRGLKNHSSEK